MTHVAYYRKSHAKKKWLMPLTISIHSETATLAAINVFIFLGSMLFTYYLYYWQGGAPTAIMIDIILYVILVVSIKRLRVQRA